MATCVCVCVQIKGSSSTARPSKVLEAEAEILIKAWRGSKDAGMMLVPDRESLGRLTAGELRAASKTFAETTSVSGDGSHPRHTALLTDQA